MILPGASVDWAWRLAPSPGLSALPLTLLSPTHSRSYIGPTSSATAGPVCLEVPTACTGLDPKPMEKASGGGCLENPLCLAARSISGKLPEEQESMVSTGGGQRGRV